MTLIISDVLKDASEVTFTDDTTYTTPARSEYYSQFYAAKVDLEDQETVVAVKSQGTPTSADSWVTVTPVDGHHRFTLILYWIWEASTSFVTGDIVVEGGNFYIATSDPGQNDLPSDGSGNWADHVPTSADTSAGQVVVQTKECILFYRLKTCFAKEVAEAASTACECDNDKKPAEVQRYEKKGVLVDGIAVDNYQLRFKNGEQKVQYMSKLCPNCN